MIRIADSISSLVDTLRRIRRHGKNGGRLDTELSPGVAALHLACLACRFHGKASQSAAAGSANCLNVMGFHGLPGGGQGVDRKKVGFSLAKGLEFAAARSPFSGDSTMARHVFFAITLIGTAVLLNAPAKAVIDAAQCEDHAANCVGRCANSGGGTNDNKCMRSCDRRVISCLIRTPLPYRRG